MKCKLNEEMKRTFTQEQKELLEQWQYYEDRILDDMVEQAFVYGYAMAVATQEEATKKLSNKQVLKSVLTGETCTSLKLYKEYIESVNITNISAICYEQKSIKIELYYNMSVKSVIEIQKLHFLHL